MRQQPAVAVKADLVVLGGGLDLVSTPVGAKPGTARFALNYEPAIGGGYESLNGIERFDGRPKPSDATYHPIAPATVFTGVTVGSAINGQASGATAKVVFVSADYIAVTRLEGTFVPGEMIRIGSTPIGLSSTADVVLTVQEDNALTALAADEYRSSITAVPGSGPIRGGATLNGVIYAWRNNADGSALVIHKATPAGWAAVPLYHQVGFTAGSAAYAEGSSLTQGAVSATVKRVVLESGAWGTSSAAGRLIITAPTGGAFAAGAATGGGAATLAGASVPITLAPGGRVVTDTYNFTASLDTRRLYGCDGVNPEFEFDGDVLVPLATGMTGVRAHLVKAHKNHLFFMYRGSLQSSGVGAPYIWSPLYGAAELGTGDVGTNLLPVGGSETASALMIFCQDSVHVLYGDAADGPSPWSLKKLSDETGANPYSAQFFGTAIAHDAPGFRTYSATQAFGNFFWQGCSEQVAPIVTNLKPVASVLSKKKGLYRVFFSDGTAVSGMPRTVPGDPAVQAFAWMPIDYGRAIVCAWEAEVDGVSSVFYGDGEGFIYEADIGTSFDGEPIECAMRLSALNQKSPVVEKQYRRVDLEASGFGYFTVALSAEFSDEDVTIEAVDEIGYEGQGAALRWDHEAWDRAYWESGALAQKRFTFNGKGYNIAPLFHSSSASQFPHQLKSLMLQYTPRRISR